MTHTHITTRTGPGSYWIETTAGPVEIWPQSAVQVMVTAGQSNNAEEASDPITINGVPYDLRLTLTRVEAVEEEARIMTAGNGSNGSNPLGSPDRVWAESNGWARLFGSRYGEALSRGWPDSPTAAAQRHLNAKLLPQITAALEEMRPELMAADAYARAQFWDRADEKATEMRARADLWDSLAAGVNVEGWPISGGWLMSSELNENRGPRDWVYDSLSAAVIEEARR